MATTKTAPKATKTMSTSNVPDFNSLIASALAGVKPEKKKEPKKELVCQLSDPAPIKLLSALNAISKLTDRIKTYGNGVLKQAAFPVLSEHILNGGAVQSVRVRADGAECLAVIQRRYASIRDKSVYENLGIELVEAKSYSFSDAINAEIAANPAVLAEIEAVIAKSKNVSIETRTRVAAGLVNCIEEKVSHEFASDPLTNLHELSGGDIERANQILDTVAPVTSIRSFVVNDSKVDANMALELIRSNMTAIGGADSDESDD